ncbi:hypothetical protein GCM10009593_21530 [Microlunatus antarcticus]
MVSAGAGHGGAERLSSSTGGAAAAGWSAAFVCAGALHEVDRKTTVRLRVMAATDRGRRVLTIEMMGRLLQRVKVWADAAAGCSPVDG